MQLNRFTATFPATTSETQSLASSSKMRVRLRTLALVASYLLADLLLTLTTWAGHIETWPDQFFAGLVTSQLCLLGMSGGFSRSRRYSRLSIVSAGSVAIWLVLAVSLPGYCRTLDQGGFVLSDVLTVGISE